MKRPSESEYHPFYKNYIELTRGADLLQNLQDSGDRLINILNEMGSEKENYSYSEGKWTLKQMLRHIIDCDLVFIYRAISISRKDKNPLPGFDQNEWAENANLENISLAELIDDFTLLRRFIIRNIKGLREEDLDQIGNTNGSPSSARAIGFIIAGHSFHHCNILQERYL
tara:strand:- start:3834 stop:4343 length:510 start_codon:yes stop_codon:yes gene_type:complete